MGGFLSVKELDQKDRERAMVNHQTYKHIYDLCTNQIRRQHSTGNTCTVFTVPTFVIGRTPFTHDHAIRYILAKLERGGFRVTENRESYPGVLFIDWSRHLPEKDAKKDSKSHAPRDAPRDTPRDARRVTPRGKHRTKKEKHTRFPPPREKIEEPLKVRLARLQSRAIMNA